MELIDKDALVAEIERLKNVLSDPLMKINGVDYITGGKKIIKEMEFFLNTLEVKEVDIEKEFDKYFFNFVVPDTGEKLKREECWLNIRQAKKFAKHFFEFGLKAQKGK